MDYLSHTVPLENNLMKAAMFYSQKFDSFLSVLIPLFLKMYLVGNP